MNSRDFVYDQIYRNALKAGATEYNAKENAILGLQDYKRGKFDKAINLINDRIKKAVQESKNERSTAK